MIRPVRISQFAAIGATTAMLWLSPAMAGDQTLPGATVESVVAIAKRLNPTVAAAPLDFDAAVHKIGTAGVLTDPTLVLGAWDVNSLGVGQRRFGVEQEFKLWGKYGLGRCNAETVADARYDVEALRKVVQIHVTRQLPPARSYVDDAKSGFQAGSTDLFFVRSGAQASSGQARPPEAQGRADEIRRDGTSGGRFA
jgi:hypothetical protein